MDAFDPPTAVIHEMIWMAWFLTGNESASYKVLRSVTCDGEGETSAPLSLANRARLLVLRTYYRVFGQSDDEPVSTDHIEKNPIWVLPPVERAVFVLRLVMGQGEQDAARQLGLPQKVISNILTKAAERLASAAGGYSEICLNNN